MASAHYEWEAYIQQVKQTENRHDTIDLRDKYNNRQTIAN